MTTPESLSMIERLVAFDTTSRKSNLDAIAFIRDHLAGLGVAARLTFDDEGGKANLWATLGPADRPGIVLSGHTDVVPTEGQEWRTPPFRATATEGRLYGRGTADMKSFIAACLTLAPEFLERGLRVPIHFAFSYDEEVGCIGVRRLLAALAEEPVRPRLCIVGEPTEMRVITAHKGKLGMRCRVRGLESHSALAHLGVNAVEAAAAAIGHLRSMQDRLREHGSHDDAFEPPYTTLHVGTIGGGRALNIVPSECVFEFEIRALPGDDAEVLLSEFKEHVASTIEPAMRAVDARCGFAWEEINTTAGLDMAADDEAVRLVASLAGANDTGKVSFGTEAGLFQQAGIPTVVCGPGSIAQAHRPDEFIELEQIAQCERFLRRLMDRVCERGA